MEKLIALSDIVTSMNGRGDMRRSMRVILVPDLQTMQAILLWEHSFRCLVVVVGRLLQSMNKAVLAK